jgi:hypothetical protein
MVLQVKIMANYRYQLVEEEFNAWAQETRPFIIKSILTTQAVPKQEGGNSLYFALAVFYNVDGKQYAESEVIQRKVAPSG